MNHMVFTYCIVITVCHMTPSAAWHTPFTTVHPNIETVASNIRIGPIVSTGIMVLAWFGRAEQALHARYQRLSILLLCLLEWGQRHQCIQLPSRETPILAQTYPSICSLHLVVDLSLGIISIGIQTACQSVGSLPQRMRMRYQNVFSLYQTQFLSSGGAPDKYTGIWQALVKVYKEDGARGYWRGNGANCVRVIPYSATQVYSPPLLALCASMLFTKSA